MKVSLIKRNCIYSINLPANVNGSYWIKVKDIDGSEKEIINVEEYQGKWRIQSNAECKIVDPNNKVINEEYIADYRFYFIKIQGETEPAFLYCEPVYDTTFTQYSVKDVHEILIGSDKNNHIVANTEAISKVHAKMTYSKGIWTIQDMNSTMGIYVNKERVTAKTLANGDSIFIMGIRMVPLSDDLFVNNPFNIVSVNNIYFEKKEKTINATVSNKEEEEVEVNLYEEEDYFFRSPRFRTVIEKELLTIDPPPTRQNMEEMPLVFMIGPMLTMGMTSMVTMYTSLSSVLDGSRELSSAMPSLVIGFAMLISMILWPLLNKRYQKAQKLKREEERQGKYGHYIETRRDEIDLIMKKQRQILIENLIPMNICENIILQKERQLWERKIDQSDFLEVRLGMGAKALEIDIRYPEDHFTMEEDNLKAAISSVVNKSKDIDNVPISVSFTEKYIAALVGKDEDTARFMKQIILQFITFHSYEDLKIIIFTNENNKKNWEYLKIIPHLWNNDKTIRYFATNYDEMKNLSAYLEKELSSRMPEGSSSGIDYKSFSPYYILITDDYNMAQNVEVVDKILKQKINIGFNILVISDKLTRIPNECTTFISVSDKSGGMFESELISKKKQEFLLDMYDGSALLPCCTKIANIPIKLSKGNFIIPTAYTFLEMYNVGKVEQLNSMLRWSMSNVVKTLQAPIGIDNHGMPLILDIHEKAHGPHGLVAGMTGSGKSELIITYILSLAVNYHPDDVSFILIDYKGGGLAGAFKNEESGIKLPHLAGTITNLDTAEMNRSLVSIQSELRRRQAIFNEARDALGEGTIDIYKYQKLYHEGLVKEPVSHLIIISDEFAELKAQQPEFMDQLISAARIGRSLGVHLILATQKPSGVVNDQIWSNTRFRICLKVQEKSDSNDMIKVPDAASIKQTGRFYLQVGYNELFELGQSAWCGAQYTPTDKLKKKVDSSINYVDNIGQIMKEVDEVKKTDASNNKGEQLTNIVKYLSDLANKESINIRQLWLDKIPAFISVNRLTQKYNYQVEKFNINPIIGEYDDPFNQRQYLLTMPVTEDGNTIIYGSSGSGVEMMLNTLIGTTIMTHSTEEVNIYIMEFGSESLRMFSKAPQVGDILFANDSDKISNLFKLVKTEIEKRKKLFVDYNGDFKTFNKNSNSKVPNMLIIINNYEVFTELYSQYEDAFMQLTRECIRYGIYFIITATSASSVRYRLSQNFKQKFVLQLNNDSDYSTILGNVKKTRPAEMKGRGLINSGGIFEYQTAQICEEEKLVDYVKTLCEGLAKESTIKAKAVPVLPEKVTLDFVRSEFKNLKTIPIGVRKDNLTISLIDLTKNYVTRVSGQDVLSLSSFAEAFITQLTFVQNVDLVVIDAEEIVSEVSKLKCKYVVKDINNIYDEIMKKIREKHNQYVNNNMDLKGLPYVGHIICIITGIDKFKTKLSDENKGTIDEFFEKAKDLEFIEFIMFDSIDRFKKVEYDNWCRNVVNSNDGIWIGNGVTEQYSMKIGKTTKDLYENIGNEFGYVIEKGIPYLIKLIENKMGDKNE